MDIQELDRRAVLGSVEVVSAVTADDLGRPTPCAKWTLAELLAHMTAQHHGFAAAAAGRGADPAGWEERPLGDDPVPAYRTAADHVIAAFAEDGVLQRRFTIPAISTRLTFPGAQAISFHFIDYVVHAWDVASSLGVPFELDEELAEPALRVARAVPDGPERLEPGAAFRPSVNAPDGADRMELILAMLGRSPNWPR